jgi:ABC-type transport system substrate-binding protein
MRDKTLVISALLIAMMLSMSVLSVSAWYFAADGSENDTFNAWGPRIDRLLIKKYTSIEAVAAALQGGEIDITDWALTPALVATLSTDPNVVLQSYGGESGYFTISLNWNNEQFLGNPPDPAYANPVYPNPMSVLAFRQASTHLVDRNYLCNVLAGGAYAPMFTPIPPYMAGYVHPQINYAGTLAALAYPPSIPDAAALLTANGFPVNGGTGKRYWDINGNGVDDGGSEDFSLIFLSRSDLLRKSAADLLAAGYDALGVPYVRSEVTGGQAAVIAMTDKNYHIYTAGWSGIGPDPDFM